VLVFLVDGSDCLDFCLERFEDLFVLDAQVDIQAGHRVKLGQQLQRLCNLHQHNIAAVHSHLIATKCGPDAGAMILEAVCECMLPLVIYSRT